jgi:hypothetical protein
VHYKITYHANTNEMHSCGGVQLRIIYTKMFRSLVLAYQLYFCQETPWSWSQQWPKHVGIHNMQLNTFITVLAWQRVKCNSEIDWLWECRHSPPPPLSSLRAGWSGDRILVAARFSEFVQTSLGADPASYTIGIRYLSCRESGGGV